MDDRGRLIIPGSNFVGKTFEELGTKRLKPNSNLREELQNVFTEDGVNRKERRANRAKRLKELRHG